MSAHSMRLFLNGDSNALHTTVSFFLTLLTNGYFTITQRFKLTVSISEVLKTCSAATEEK